MPITDYTSIEIDGQITEKEWGLSYTKFLGDSLEIHLLNTPNMFYIGVKSKTSYAIFTDIYFLIENHIINLHASMQLGERVSANTPLNTNYPPFHWGNNTDWIANIVSIDQEVDKGKPFHDRVHQYDGQEFQINKSKLPKGVFGIRIEIQDFEGIKNSVIWPNTNEFIEVTLN